MLRTDRPRRVEAAALAPPRSDETVECSLRLI